MAEAEADASKPRLQELLAAVSANEQASAAPSCPRMSCLTGAEWPSQSSVDSALSVLYVALNGVQRLMHALRRASGGLVPEEDVRQEVEQLEHAVEKAKYTMDEHQRSIRELRQLVTVYERGVWDKSEELEQMRRLQATMEAKVFENVGEMNRREELIASLQQHILGLEGKVFTHVEHEQSQFKLFMEVETQTDEPAEKWAAPAPENPAPEAASRRGRRKLDSRHPMLLKVRCDGCSTPMNPARWRNLPGRAQRAIAEAQKSVDATVRAEQAKVQELLTDCCPLCRDVFRAGVALNGFDLGDGEGALHRAPQNKDARQRSLLGMLLQDTSEAAPSTAVPPIGSSFGTSVGPTGTPTSAWQPHSARASEVSPLPAASAVSPAGSALSEPAPKGLVRRSLTAVNTALRRRSVELSDSARAGDGDSPPGELVRASTTVGRQQRQGQLRAAATLQYWREAGFAFDITVPREQGARTGLRLRDKDLEVLSVDKGTACSACAEIIPLGAYVVGIFGTPVQRMDAEVKALLQRPTSEMVFTFAPRPLASGEGPCLEEPGCASGRSAESEPAPTPARVATSPERVVTAAARSDDTSDDESSDEYCTGDPLCVGTPRKLPAKKTSPPAATPPADAPPAASTPAATPENPPASRGTNKSATPAPPPSLHTVRRPPSLHAPPPQLPAAQPPSSSPANADKLQALGDGGVVGRCASISTSSSSDFTLVAPSAPTSSSLTQEAKTPIQPLSWFKRWRSRDDAGTDV
eukprot:TRINITY_DN1136_c0_g1_i1.p1 TRINITY_DN1136_c0_g1~~TRINITY_DN1136_c0_g1_i1.p1  ORF type:complete len:773 (+),score=170.88 TRINITY_DN1136_c0_g1_i1:61-2319(+)